MAERRCLPLAEVATASVDGSRPVAHVDVAAAASADARCTTITRQGFLARIQAWCAAFMREPGAKLALYIEHDSAEFAAALYGAWHAGKEVWLPGDAQAATQQRLRELAPLWAGDLPGGLRASELLPSDHAMPAGEWPELARLDPQSTRLIVFTSGSTGEPSAIAKTLAQLDAEVQALDQTFGAALGSEACVRATVSHQHIYGLLFGVLWPLASGRPFAAQRLVYPEQMAAQLGLAPHLLVSSPAHLSRLPEALDWSAARRGLRAVFSSGGPLSMEAALSAEARLGQVPIEVFGSSETGGIAWRRQREGDAWRAFAPVAWRLDEGCLAVRSPYLPNDDWFLTADKARAVANTAGEPTGFVLLGRADRIVKIEEKRVSITALEHALKACDEVADARLLLLPDAQSASNDRSRTLRLAAVVVPSAAGWALMQAEGKLALNERLRSALLAQVERIALPRRWRYVQALPLTAQGKVTEALLAALFDDHPRQPAVQWRSRDALQAEALLDVSPQLAVFEGHFPGAPILPGVAQLDWAIALGRECFDLPPRFLRAETLKFLKPVQPGTQLALRLQWHVPKQALQFTFESAAGPHASGQLVFGAAHA